ncbi:MAG: GTPase HflX, partial [Flavobacteriaceae bacterium]
DAYTYDTIDEDDLVTEKTSAYYSLEDWQKTWMGGDKNTSIFISALNKENLEAFKETTYEEVKEIHIQRFPYNDFLYYEYKEE